MESLNKNKIELRSEPLQEILEQIPNWIIRSGTTIFLFIITILLLGCWIFKYPDTIQTQIVITPNNPSSSVIAKTTGKLVQIFVHNNQKVKKNEVLAIIENTANYNHINYLKALMDSLRNSFNQLNLSPNFFENSLILGEVQSYYSSFLKQYQDFNNFLILNYYNKRSISIKNEIKQQETLQERLGYKINFEKEKLILQKKQYHRDSLLFKNDVLAATDFEKSKMIYIESQNNYNEIKNEIININIQILKLQQTVQDLELQRIEQSSKQMNALKESLDVLFGQVTDWENKYVLKAPISGGITFTGFWNNSQNVKTGDIVFNVVPDNSSFFIGRIQLPIKNSGKVSKDQKVIIELDNYPYMEFGMLQGKISSISLVSDNNFFIAEVEFPSKLVTNFNKKLIMTNELKGTAMVVTSNIRLLNRLIYPLKALFKKNI